MNYSRHRIAAKKKLQEKNSELQKLEGSERAKAEQLLIDQAKKESEEESEKVNSKRRRGRPNGSKSRR